jgi:N-acyl-D-amino-acid deacylase
VPQHLVRRFALPALILGLVCTAALGQRAGAEERPPITGQAVPRLKRIDAVMLEILHDHHIPGGSLAIAREGKLVFARGYGWADVENKKPVVPSSRFNIASCSKAITASAILKLVDEGKLRLGDKAFAMLDNLKPSEGAKVDPRLRDITVRQLLHHAGGVTRQYGLPIKREAIEKIDRWPAHDLFAAE